MDKYKQKLIHALSDINTDGEVVRWIERNFPELRESEDERIRKLLVEKISNLACGCFVSQEQKQKFIHYLEKQKEQKSDAKSERVIKAARRVLNNWLDGTDCPDVSGDFAELEYAIREYDGEEKLKENPKSTDSIPADCVSDAKCENRWHKVQDSLPDNGRLVLAQDCLGNTLLARYDGEGNWEVSVYDNEDYYCRNAITKWCEIPSEKQKEQRPKNILTDDDSLQTAYLKGQTDVLEDPEAYGLQKEQKPVECVADSIKFDEGFKTGREVGFREGVESVKPAEWSEEDEKKLEDLTSLLAILEGCSTVTVGTAAKYNGWINSFRGRPKSSDNWKPSEEQMIALYNMIPFVKSVGGPSEAVKPLESLYEDLKKL